MACGYYVLGGERGELRWVELCGAGGECGAGTGCEPDVLGGAGAGGDAWSRWGNRGAGAGGTIWRGGGDVSRDVGGGYGLSRE